MDYLPQGLQYVNFFIQHKLSGNRLLEFFMNRDISILIKIIFILKFNNIPLMNSDQFKTDFFNLWQIGQFT